MTHRAVYPGTFDPITNGHVDIIERASVLFPELIVAVGQNARKQPFLSFEARIACIKDAVSHLPGVKVLGFEELLVDFMKKKKARFIVRGLRAVSDFEYEFQLAGMNRQLSNDIETVFFTPSPDCMFISSTLVREIASLGGDVANFVPKSVSETLKRALQTHP